MPLKTSYEEEQDILLTYLSAKFQSFEIGDCLSDFACTFFVCADDTKYVVKLLHRFNYVSILDHNRSHVQNIVAVSNSVNDKNIIKTVDIVDIVYGDDYSILLLKVENLKVFQINSINDFYDLGFAVRTFHDCCKNLYVQELPWDNFPRHFISVLQKNSRWSIISDFIEDNKAYIQKVDDKVVCHNDIHEGNLFLSDNKMLFLDIDDICQTSYFNDLGIIIANYINTSYSHDELIYSIDILLKGYRKPKTKKAVITTLIFSLRKLYFTEAYYLFAEENGINNNGIICDLRKKQDMIQCYIERSL